MLALLGTLIVFILHLIGMLHPYSTTLPSFYLSLLPCRELTDLLLSFQFHQLIRVYATR
jgi:hypothetical protein